MCGTTYIFSYMPKVGHCPLRALTSQERRSDHKSSHTHG